MALRFARLVACCALLLAACGGRPAPSPDLAGRSLAPNLASSPGPSQGQGGSSPSATTPATALPTMGGTWSPGVATPSRRAENAAVAVDGVIYVAGGMGDHGDTLDRFEAFDTRTGTWSELPPLPERRDHMGLAAIDGKIYLTGGMIFYDTAVRSGLWRYDPADRHWTSLRAMPGKRAQHASVALGGKIYVVGGIADAGRARELWAYDPADGSWQADLAPLPTEREHLEAVATDSLLIAIGGRLGRQIGAVEAYDPQSNSWRSLPDLPTPRGGSAAALIGSVIHVAGGEDLNNMSTFAQHEALDLEKMTWYRAPDLPTKRHGLASAVVDGRWYVIGGGRSAGTSISDIVEVYTP
jgi:N-acetylneuraminic acid mutarotase